MMNINTNTNYHNVRDSKGRFAPKSQALVRNTRKPVMNYHNVRDSKGRFVSAVEQKEATAVIQTSVKSSFIKILVVSRDHVAVVMNRYPNVQYTYTPTASVLKIIKEAIVAGTSLGNVYNKYLRGNASTKRAI